MIGRVGEGFMAVNSHRRDGYWRENWREVDGKTAGSGFVMALNVRIV
jgi:hypothetical protein